MGDLISREAAIKLILSGRVGDDSLVECPEECNSMLEWAADEVAKMPTADTMKWIPVAERLPTIGEEVLTYCSDINFIEISSLEKYVGDYHWENQNGDWQVLEGVTAWMPLPMPWRGEEDDDYQSKRQRCVDSKI